MLLLGCSTNPEVLIKTEYITALPPTALIQDVPAPIWKGGTNQALTNYILLLQSSIEQCNNDKQLLREFTHERFTDAN